MATEVEVAELMGVMVHAWPRYELVVETIHVYARLLADLPHDALEVGAKHLMTTGKFFPSISEWREAAVLVMSNGVKIPSEFEAWEEVQRVLEREVALDHLKFSHPLIARAVEVMGYHGTNCQSDLIGDRAHFFRVYRDQLDRAKAEAVMLPEVRAESERYQKQVRKSAQGPQLLAGWSYEKQFDDLCLAKMREQGYTDAALITDAEISEIKNSLEAK